MFIFGNKETVVVLPGSMRAAKCIEVINAAIQVINSKLNRQG